MTNFKKISDNVLFIRCKKCGKEALQARQRFAGLLPEVCKRRLYEKKNFASIYEFAAKLAGLSRDQVDAVIRLERKFEDKPMLHTALVEGQISANKLIRIASIATTDNQGELFAAAQKLSKTAIDVYVKDYKHARSEMARNGGPAQSGLPQCAEWSGNEVEGRNGLLQLENSPRTLPGQTSANIDFEIIAALTPDLKIKIKALLGKGINVSELFTEFLESREQEIEMKKDEIAAKLERKLESRTQVESDDQPVETNQQKPVTRHISACVKKIIKYEFGTKCAHSNCNNAAKNLHHQKQFAIFRTHDPRFIKPLCKGHHELEHSSDNTYRYFKFASSV